MEEFLHFEPLNQCTDDFLNPSELSNPYDLWMSKGSEMFQITKSTVDHWMIYLSKARIWFSTLLSSQVPKKYDSHIFEGSKLNEAKKTKLSVPLKDNMWGYNQGENMAMLNSLDCKTSITLRISKKTLWSYWPHWQPMSGENFSCFGNSIPLPLWCQRLKRFYKKV